MIKKIILLISMYVMVISAMAWNNGDRFTSPDAPGITYQVIDISNYKVQIVTASNECLVNGDEFRPAATIKDPNDPNITFKLVEVTFSSNPGRYPPGNVRKMYIPEGVVTVYLASTNCPYAEFPSTLKSFKVNPWISSNAFTTIVFPNGSNYYKFENGALLSSDGKILYWKSNALPADGSYTVQDGVETIDNCCFNACSNLKVLNLPASVKTIQDDSNYAQFSTKNLKTINVADGNQNFVVIDGALYKKESNGKLNLLQYPARYEATTFKVADDCEYVSRYALANQMVKSVDLNNVVGLDWRAISGMSNLKSLDIPATLIGYGEGKIYDCPNLSAINFDPENSEFASIDGVIFSKDLTKLYQFPSGRTGQYKLPASVVQIMEGAFAASKLSKFISNANLTTVHDNAFSSCQITEYDFSPATQPMTFGQTIFDHGKMTTFTLPKTLKNLGYQDFIQCYSLNTINIPDGSLLESIDSECFTNNTGLVNVNFLGSCPNLTIINSGAFNACSNLQNINLPSSVTYIGSRAFGRCAKLTSFTIPDETISIGSSAFYDCTNLATVNFPANPKIKKIGRNAFDGVGLQSLTLTEGIETIEAEAFIGCDNLTSIDIPASLTSLDPQAFKFCNSLTNINVAEDNPVYASVDGILMSKDLKTILCFPAGKANMNTLLPPTVEKIGDYAFYANENLTNVTLPAKVKEMGVRAFGLCSNLDNITFLGSTKMDPSGINQIENKMSFDNGAADQIRLNVRAAVKEAYELDPFYSTFRGVEPSAKVGHDEYIPMSATAAMLLSTDATDKVYSMPSTINGYCVTNVGDNAFDGITGIEEVIVPATVTDLGFQAFKNSPVTSIIFLGSAVKAATEKYNYPDTDNEFNDNQNIYVRRSQKDAFKASMPRFAGQITNEISFETPSREYSTFSREFATDFSQGGSNTAANPKFIAFSSGIHEKNGDTETIVMHSINEGTTGDGTLVPANTGVVFKTYTSAPSYYEIADDQSKPAVSGVVVPVLEQTTVSPGVGSLKHYYIGKSDGKAHLIESPISIGAHKAYLKVTVSAGAKKIAFRFADSDDSATGINEVETESEKSEAIYNLNGQRINPSARGILVRGGKKYVNK